MKIVLFFLFAITLFIGSPGVSSTVFAQQTEEAHFMAELSGKSGIPPNLSTKTIGNAIFTLTQDGNEMLYTVNAVNINRVTDVVLVLSTGGVTSNVAFLRSGSQHGATGAINGLLVHGNITSLNLVGLLKGKQISDLVKDMLDGNIYLRVSAVKFPLEIIGKVTPAE
jgi:CHRD domain-containing protein